MAELLGRLRDSPRPWVSRADVESWGLDPETLVTGGLLQRLPAERGWTPPECEHSCTLGFDFESRQAEGLVGVMCPSVPACWPGWAWHPAAELERFRFDPRDVFEAVRERNWLDELRAEVRGPLVPVGTLRQRGVVAQVVFVPRILPMLDEVLGALRNRLGGDAAIVLVPEATSWQPTRASGAIVHPLPDPPSEDLQLWRALDALDKGYRSRRLTDPLGVMDELYVRFATVPGERHVVEVNGRDIGRFQKSDVKFLRLLLLAAMRGAGGDYESGGWLGKYRLAATNEDKAVEQLRAELRQVEHLEIDPDVFAALIKTSPERDGGIRLAVDPHHIDLDPSLAELRLVGHKASEPRGRRGNPSQGERETDMAKAAESCRRLLREARRLGVPGDPEADLGA